MLLLELQRCRKLDSAFLGEGFRILHWGVIPWRRSCIVMAVEALGGGGGGGGRKLIGLGGSFTCAPTPLGLIPVC